MSSIPFSNRGARREHRVLSRFPWGIGGIHSTFAAATSKRTAIGNFLRRAFWGWPFLGLVLATLFAVTAAYQFDTPYEIRVGGYYDRVYIQGFHERETLIPGGETEFRWSRGWASLAFPGVGARDRILALRLDGTRPAGFPLPEVRLSACGHFLALVQAGPTWQEYRLWLPASACAGGTVRLELETDTFSPARQGAGNDPRELGVAISRAVLLPARSPFSPAWPAWDQGGWSLLFIISLYLGFVWLGLKPPWAALLAALPLAPLAWGLAIHRLWTTIYTSRLTTVALLGLFLLPLVGMIFRRLLAWGKVSMGERPFRFLLAVFWVGFLLKAGGLFYPFSVAIDLRWHLQRAAEIVDGRLAELYRPGAFSESVMPEEWGTEKPLIPYSPFYHLTAALFFFLPWRPYDTANVLSVLLDLSRPLLLYFLARRLGLDERTGVWAGLLYALLPATFLLHSWGNIPTTTGLWWTLAATCYLVGAWERLRHIRTWAGLVFFLLGALLYYTVAATFLVVFLGILLVGLALNRQERHARPLGAVALALLAALGLATAIYYGQYIGPIAEKTIPRFLESLRQGGAGLGVRPVSWPEYLLQHLLRLSGLSYGLIGPLALALGSTFLRWPEGETRPLRRWVLLAWFGTALLFFLIGFRVDMVDKEIWFVLPAVALCAAMALEWLWRRGRAGRVLVIGLLLFLAAASLYTWVFRLSTVTQEWTAHDARIVGEVAKPGGATETPEAGTGSEPWPLPLSRVRKMPRRMALSAPSVEGHGPGRSCRSCRSRATPPLRWGNTTGHRQMGESSEPALACPRRRC